MSRCYAEKQVLNSITTKLKGWTLQQTEINIMIGRLITSAYKNDLNISDIREERRKTASMMNCRPAAMFITYDTYWCLIRRDERSPSFQSCCRSEETRERLRISAETQTPVNAAERPLPRERCRESTAERTLPREHCQQLLLTANTAAVKCYTTAGSIQGQTRRTAM